MGESMRARDLVVGICAARRVRDVSNAYRCAVYEPCMRARTRFGSEVRHAAGGASACMRHSVHNTDSSLSSHA